MIKTVSEVRCSYALIASGPSAILERQIWLEKLLELAEIHGTAVICNRNSVGVQIDMNDYGWLVVRLSLSLSSLYRIKRILEHLREQIVVPRIALKNVSDLAFLGGCVYFHVLVESCKRVP